MDFTKALKGCNPGQLKAVETVEGPVLVIAGPGTGKTHILTLRIANILQKTQAKPTNILVLTFTESATRTVRKRLAEIVGDATAREVFISTFHGFCEHVLATYPDSFPAWQGKRLAGDVESALVWREVLETENLVHLRTPKSPYFYLRDLQRLRDDLVRECITLEQYRAWADTLAQEIKSNDKLHYVRGPQQGELNKAGQQKLERLEKIAEAARLIEAYEALKEERGVYDFSDVIRGVVDTIREDDVLRAELQEQYQYILADEHQDANALQHALLDLFAYDEHPNLFVVGDERQAIYRFQGADSEHFRSFLERYPRTEVIELTQSFRSLQGVLDVSHTLVEQHGPSESTFAPLTATREGTARMRVLASEDPLAERDQVASLVEEAIKEGTKPEDIAIIARTNRTADLFAEHLSVRGIDVLRSGNVDLEARPVTRLILSLMRAVADPSDTHALRLALLAPWWQASIAERVEFMRQTRDNVLLTALEDRFPAIHTTIARLMEGAQTTIPVPFFSRLLEESGARSYLLSHAEQLEDVSLVRSIVGYLEAIAIRNPDASFDAVMKELAKAAEHGLSGVKASVIEREGHVTVITAHKAKGMEFERVFVVGLTSREWEKGGRPATIPSPVDSVHSIEDALRLFYVAITRAKNELTLTYSTHTLEGRETSPSGLIPEGLESIEAVTDPLPIFHSNTDAPKLIRDLTHSYLTHEGLSPSALQEYLDSPPTFFVRRILRLKEPATPATAIGTAVHAGIAAYLETNEEDRAYAALHVSLKRCLLPRNTAFENLTEDARSRLAAFIGERAKFGSPEAIEKKYTTTRVVRDTAVVLSGNIDALMQSENGLSVIDFKTSSTIRAADEKYAVQLAFYDLLLRANGITPESALIVQVRTDGIAAFPIAIDEKTQKELDTTLNAVLEELLTGSWRTGDASEYDDLLTLFAD